MGGQRCCCCFYDSARDTHGLIRSETGLTGLSLPNLGQRANLIHDLLHEELRTPGHDDAFEILSNSSELMRFYSCDELPRAVSYSTVSPASGMSLVSACEAAEQEPAGQPSNLAVIHEQMPAISGTWEGI